MEITEGNTLIAKFMELPTKIYRHPKAQSSDPVVLYSHKGTLHIDEDLYFHSSWDWLMPVVQKIFKIPFDSVKGMSEYFNKVWDDDEVHLGSSITNVWEAVVDFIKWYNEKLKKQEL